MLPSRPRQPGPAPDSAALHEAALQHLARFAATEAGLVRVLDRRIARWLRASGEGPDAAAPSYAAARQVARALAESGVVDDAAFADLRARRLLRAGRSRRSVSAHLAAKGVDPELARAALLAEADELAAALAYARRRRLGPFRAGPDDPAVQQRELGAFARAGFPRDVAERALRIDKEEAEALLLQMRSA